MKKLIFFLFFLLVSSTTIASAYTIPSSGWEYTVGNVTYTVGSSMDFSDLDYSDSWIQFNNTIFTITSVNVVNVTLNYLCESYGTDVELVNLSANMTTVGSVTIVIGGMQAGSRYRVDMNGTTLVSTNSDGSGSLSFSNTFSGFRYFQVFGASASSDPGSHIWERSPPDDDDLMVADAGVIPLDILFIAVVLFIILLLSFLLMYKK